MKGEKNGERRRQMSVHNNRERERDFRKGVGLTGVRKERRKRWKVVECEIWNSE